jgi:hypothetical protein
MMEVFVYSSQNRVELGDNTRQTSSAGSLRQGPDPLPDVFQTFGSDKPSDLHFSNRASEPMSQKIEV